jgi:hypothetical protein
MSAIVGGPPDVGWLARANLRFVTLGFARGMLRWIVADQFFGDISGI